MVTYPYTHPYSPPHWITRIRGMGQHRTRYVYLAPTDPQQEKAIRDGLEDCISCETGSPSPCPTCGRTDPEEKTMAYEPQINKFALDTAASLMADPDHTNTEYERALTEMVMALSSMGEDHRSTVNNAIRERRHEMLFSNATYTFNVIIKGCSPKEAVKVMRERLEGDEDYGFPYTIEHWERFRP